MPVHMVNLQITAEIPGVEPRQRKPDAVPAHDAVRSGGSRCRGEAVIEDMLLDLRAQPAAHVRDLDQDIKRPLVNAYLDWRCAFAILLDGRTNRILHHLLHNVAEMSRNHLC